MGEQAQEESVQSEEQSKSLKPFSDRQLLDELGKRLGSNPNVDPVIVQKLQSIATELQKKAEVANPPPVEPEKPAEVDSTAVSPETAPETAVESEGKKWAKITREKGLGRLHSKFRSEWEYLQEDGKSCPIIPKTWAGFQDAGWFGAKNDSEYSVLWEKKITGSNIVSSEYIKSVPSRANFLLLHPLGQRTDRFSNGMIFSYYSWLSAVSCPDHRGGVSFEFRFVLPQKEREEFLSTLKKNVDLIEDVFQSVYPGLTGEKGAKLMKVEKLKVIGPGITYKDYERGKLPESRFSHPVGTVEWPSNKTARF